MSGQGTFDEMLDVVEQEVQETATRKRMDEDRRRDHFRTMIDEVAKFSRDVVAPMLSNIARRASGSKNSQAVINNPQLESDFFPPNTGFCRYEISCIVPSKFDPRQVAELFVFIQPVEAFEERIVCQCGFRDVDHQQRPEVPVQARSSLRHELFDGNYADAIAGDIATTYRHLLLTMIP